METRELRFADHRLDLISGRLFDPTGAEIHLRPRAFALLRFLVETAPEIHTPDQLLDAVWGVEHLSLGSVKQAVSEVRQALGDDPSEPRCIETVHRRGYRFVAPVEAIDTDTPTPTPPPATAPPRPAPWRRIALVGVTMVAAVALWAGVTFEPHSRAVAIDDPPTFAVVGFESLGTSEPWLGRAVSEIVSFELGASGARPVPSETVARMRSELTLDPVDTLPSASLERIGRNLGADLVVTGSYLLVPRPDDPGGDTLRLQLRVQEVATGETVAWAREEGRSDDLAHLASRIARNLGDSLGLTALAGDRSLFAASTAVMERYARGVDALRVWDAPTAREELERAAQLDPDNPLVHYALAEALGQLGHDRQSSEVAERAVELSTDLPREARLSLEARAATAADRWEEAIGLYRALHLLDPGDLEHGLGLARALRRSGQAGEALAVLDRLAAAEATDIVADPRIALQSSRALYDLGRFADSRSRAEESLRQAAAREAPLLGAAGRVALAWALFRLGDREPAFAELTRAETTFRHHGDPGGAVAALGGRAAILRESGDLEPARDAYEAALALYRQIGDRGREAATLNNLAALLAAQGDGAGTRRALERSVELKREIGDDPGLAVSLANVASLAEAQGDLNGARSALEESLALHRRLEDRDGQAFALRTLGRVLAAGGEWNRARETYLEALDLARDTGNPSSEAHCHLYLASLEVATERFPEAEEHYRHAIDLFDRIDQPSDAVLATLGVAESLIHRQRFEPAERWLARAFERLEDLDAPHPEATGHFVTGWLAEETGRPAEARRAYTRARDRWRGSNYGHKLAEAEERLARLGGSDTGG